MLVVLILNLNGHNFHALFLKVNIFEVNMLKS